MNGPQNERRALWERLDDNRAANRLIDAHTRWRVGNLAESLHRAQHEEQGRRLADEAESYLQAVIAEVSGQSRAEQSRQERQRTARAEGGRRGDPGE